LGKRNNIFPRGEGLPFLFLTLTNAGQGKKYIQSLMDFYQVKGFKNIISETF
jgi:hypothetical protein